MTIIYEPKGRASQYAPLAANIYKTCTHGCLYCYANKTMWMKKAVFHANDRTRNNALKMLANEAPKYRGDDREILLCFLGDPYNPNEPGRGITRRAIEILMENDLRFTVLTKGGFRVRRDFDLLSTYPKCSIGQTIVFSKQTSVQYWEPNASPLQERFILDTKVGQTLSARPLCSTNRLKELIEFCRAAGWNHCATYLQNAMPDMFTAFDTKVGQTLSAPQTL